MVFKHKCTIKGAKEVLTRLNLFDVLLITNMLHNIATCLTLRSSFEARVEFLEL